MTPTASPDPVLPEPPVVDDPAAVAAAVDPDAVWRHIEAAEEALRLAMLKSDVDTLDRLLASTLIFTNHLGQVFGKGDDLLAHRSGQLRVAALAPSETQIAVHGATAVVSVRMQVVGIYQGSPFAGDFRYTRCWALQADGLWRVVAGHVSELPAPAAPV